MAGKLTITLLASPHVRDTEKQARTALRAAGFEVASAASVGGDDNKAALFTLHTIRETDAYIGLLDDKTCNADVLVGAGYAMNMSLLVVMVGPLPSGRILRLPGIYRYDSWGPQVIAKLAEYEAMPPPQRWS